MFWKSRESKSSMQIDRRMRNITKLCVCEATAFHRSFCLILVPCITSKNRQRILNLASSNEERYRMQSEVSHFEHVDFHNSPNFQLWSFLSDARRWCNVPFDVLRFRESRSTAQTERRISNRARLCGFERHFRQRLVPAGLFHMIYRSASKSLATLQAAHRMTELSVGIL